MDPQAKCDHEEDAQEEHESIDGATFSLTFGKEVGGPNVKERSSSYGEQYADEFNGNSTQEEVADQDRDGSDG